MTDEKRILLKQLPHYLSGRVAVMLLGFVSFPLFTRLYSVAQYGELSLVIKIVAMATVLSKAGIPNSIFRFSEEQAVSGGADALRVFYSTVVSGTVLLAALCSTLFLLSLQVFPASIVPSALHPAYLLGAGLIFVRTLYSVALTFLRVENRSKTYNILEVLTKLQTILLVLAIFFSFSKTITAFIAGSLIAESVTVAFFLASIVRRHLFMPRLFDPAMLRQVLAFGLPLIVYEFAGLVLDSGDRFVIQYFAGSQAVGLYSAAHNISNYIYEFFVTPLALASVPMFLKTWANRGERETAMFLSRTIDYFVVAAIGITAATVVTARDAVRLLASAKYEPASTLVPLVTAGLMIYSLHIFLNVPMYIHKQSVRSAAFVVISCTVNLGLNLMLVPKLGVTGSALSTLLSYSLLIGLVFRQSHHLMPLPLSVPLYWKSLGAGLATALLVSQLQTPFAVTSFLLKGTSSVVLYTLLITSVDRAIRQSVYNTSLTLYRSWFKATADAIPL